MKQSNWSFILKVLLILASTATTMYLLMLGWYNTLSLDDYGFVVDLAHMSPWEWTMHVYMTWQGRFSTFLVSGCIFKIWGHATSLFSWTIIHLLLGYAVAYLYMRDVLKVKNVVSRCALAVLVSNITIMSVFEISTFYWLCCAGYFLVIYATLLLFYVLFVSKWKGWMNTIIAIVCTLYISGSAENYTPLVLMTLGIIWLIVLIRDAKQSSFNEAFCKHWLLFTVCAMLVIGFVVMVVAPGNKVRMAQEDGEMVGFMYQFDLVLFIKKTVVANMIFALRLISRGLYWLGLLPIFMYIGIMQQDKGIAIASSKIGKRVLIATVLLVGFLFISVTACVYGIGYYPPLRSMSFVSFAMVAYLCYVGCLLGYRMAEKKYSWGATLAICCLVGWSVFAVYEFVRENPEVESYHNFISERNELVQKEIVNGRTEVLYIKAYEAPRWKNTYSYLRTVLNRCLGLEKVVEEPYFPYMISNLDKTNPEDFKNKGLQDYYNADFKILERR